MVFQVLPHAGEVVYHWNPQAPQLRGRPHAGEQHQVRRAHRAGAENDLLGLHGESISTALHQQAGGFCPLKHDPADLAIGAHRQVETMARLSQVAQGSAEPHPVVVVAHAWTDAIGVRMVVVVGLVVTAGPAGAEKGPLHCIPRVRIGMVHEDGPLGTVVVSVLVDISFRFAEERQDLFVTPLVIAAGGPRVEILGNASIEGRGVDRAGPTGNPAPGHQHRRRQVGRGRCKLPVVRVGGQPDRVAGGGSRSRRNRSGGKAVLELVGQQFEVQIVRPGLQQQHRALRIFR